MPHLTSEQYKKNQSIIATGRSAYKMLIPSTGNPNSKQPDRDLWDKGWRIERKNDPANWRPKSPKEFHSKPARPSHTQPRTATPSSKLPVITGSLIARFNDNHQTRA